MVITGIGIISPIGIGVHTFWQGLKEGRDGITDITLFDPSGLDCRQAAQVDFQPEQFLGKKGLKYLDRTTRLTCCATALALSDAGLPAEPGHDLETGLILGTAFGSMDSISRFDQEALREGPRYVNPMAFPNTVMNSAAGHTAIRFGLTGINSTISTGMVSGLHAIRCAFDYIHSEQAEILLAGGAEELCPPTCVALSKMSVLARERMAAVPFDLDRNGFLPGEGAALLVMESLQHAKKRGARIYAEILGFGTAFDRTENGLIDAMSSALNETDMRPQRVTSICAGANGSILEDAQEAQAIRKVFGSRAASLAVSAIKSMVGETLGASGAFQAACGVMSLIKGIIPPTLHFRRCDPGWGLTGIRNHAVKQDVPVAMINGMERDGNCASLLIGRMQDD